MEATPPPEQASVGDASLDFIDPAAGKPEQSAPEGKDVVFSSDAPRYFKSRCQMCRSMLVQAEDATLVKCPVCTAINPVDPSAWEALEPSPPLDNANAESWRYSQVGVFLQQLNLAHIIPNFERRYIDGKQLLQMNQADVRSIGVRNEADIITLFSALPHLKTPSSEAPPPVPPSQISTVFTLPSAPDTNPAHQPTVLPPVPVVPDVPAASVGDLLASWSSSLQQQQTLFNAFRAGQVSVSVLISWWRAQRLGQIGTSLGQQLQELATLVTEQTRLGHGPDGQPLPHAQLQASPELQALNAHVLQAKNALYPNLLSGLQNQISQLCMLITQNLKYADQYAPPMPQPVAPPPPPAPVATSAPSSAAGFGYSGTIGPDTGSGLGSGSSGPAGQSSSSSGLTDDVDMSVKGRLAAAQNARRRKASKKKRKYGDDSDYSDDDQSDEEWSADKPARRGRGAAAGAGGPGRPPGKRGRPPGRPRGSRARGRGRGAASHDYYDDAPPSPAPTPAPAAVSAVSDYSLYQQGGYTQGGYTQGGYAQYPTSGASHMMGMQSGGQQHLHYQQQQQQQPQQYYYGPQYIAQ